MGSGPSICFRSGQDDSKVVPMGDNSLNGHLKYPEPLKGSLIGSNIKQDQEDEGGEVRVRSSEMRRHGSSKISNEGFI